MGIARPWVAPYRERMVSMSSQVNLSLVPRLVGFLLAVALFLACVAGAAAAAVPKKAAHADAHDRALALKLLRLHASAAIDGTGDVDLDQRLAACANYQALSEDEKFAVDIAMLLPALAQTADEHEAVFVQVDRQVAQVGVPHSRVFRQWLVVLRAQLGYVKTLAAHTDSTQMDLCAFVDKVLAQRTDDAAFVEAMATLGVDETGAEALIALLNPERALGKPEADRRKQVEQRFAAFLAASGFTKKQIATLLGS
jgi:hypothetical protein